MRMEISNPALVSSERNFGLWVGFYFTMNVVVGAGFLTLPNIFKESGWLFSCVFMTYSAIQSYYIAYQTIEVMSRAEVILRLSTENINIKRPGLKELFLGRNANQDLLGESDICPEITDRRIDICECVRVLFGPKISIVYSFMLSLLVLGIMTAYAGIFASSLASEIPLGFQGTCNIYEAHSISDPCYKSYWVFIAVFLVLSLVLMVIGLKEQKWVQSAFSILRFIVMTSLILLSLSLIIAEKEVDSDKEYSASMPNAINISKIGGGISTILFAFSYQIQFPSITEFVTDKKKHLMLITKMVVITCFTFYILIGFMVSVGVSDLSPLATLSFRNYSAGYSQEDRPGWTYLIAYFMTLFPAADVFSSFPLMGIGLSDNLITLTYGASNTASTPKKALILYRVVICVIPIFIAFFEYDLGNIINWIGVSLFFLIPIMIPLMHIAARIMVPRRGFYDVPYAPRWLSLVLSGFSVFFLIFYVSFEAKDSSS